MLRNLFSGIFGRKPATEAPRGAEKPGTERGSGHGGPPGHGTDRDRGSTPGRATGGEPGGGRGAQPGDESDRGRDGLPEAQPGDEPEYLDYESWDGVTTGESFPDLTTPATYSFARRFYRAAYRDLARLHGMAPDDLDACDMVFQGMLGYLRGRIYLRDRSWAAYEQILAALPGNPDLDRHLARHLPEYLNYLAQTRLDLLERVGGLEIGDLVDLYREAERALFHGAGLTVATDMRVIREFAAATEAMVAHGIDPESPEGTLLLAHDNLAGAAGTRYLLVLAEQIRMDPGLISEMRGKPEEVLERVAHDPALAPIREGLEAYLGSYGHRGPGEMLLERQMPIDRPDLVVARLQALVETTRPADHEPHGDAVTPDCDGSPPGASASHRFPGGSLPPDLARRLADAHEWIAWRERMRAGRAGIFDAGRRLLKEIGVRLTDLGVLERADDIWYLAVEEILDFCEGHGLQEDLGALVTLRRRELAAWREDPPPDAWYSRGPAGWAPSRWSDATEDKDMSGQGHDSNRQGGERGADSEGERHAEAERGQGADAKGERGADAKGERDADAKGERDAEAERGQGADAECEPARAREAILRGVVAWPGRVDGVARVLHDPSAIASLEGAILVADRTDPGWTPLFPTARAILIEHGNPLCHAAILARELKIPTLVGVRGLLATVRDGDRLEVDAAAGLVRVLGPTLPDGADSGDACPS